MTNLRNALFLIFFSFQYFAHSSSLKIALTNGSFEHAKTGDEKLDKILKDTYYWALPLITKSPLKIHSIESVIALLIVNHNFPNIKEINDFILSTDQFLMIEDKYLLINYITNFTPFAQTYVDKYSMSTQEFEAIIENTKSKNVISKHYTQ